MYDRKEPQVQVSEVEWLRQELAEERRLHGVTIDQRDHAQDMADRLAAALAPNDVLGEHTSSNDPWQNALDHAGVTR